MTLRVYEVAVGSLICGTPIDPSLGRKSSDENETMGFGGHLRNWRTAVASNSRSCPSWRRIATSGPMYRPRWQRLLPKEHTASGQPVQRQPWSELRRLVQVVQQWATLYKHPGHECCLGE